MDKFLITPSLYGSFLWYTDTDFSKYDDRAEEFEQQAYNDWLNTLKKVKTPTTEAQQKGLDFENAVQEFTTNSDYTGNILSEAELSAAKETANILGKGGIWQQKLMKETDNYLLYGYADYIRQNTIYDVKRTSSYEEGKYIKSIQHQIYMECADIENFKYVISAGKTTPNVYVEYYHKEPNNLENLIGKIDLMVDFIKAVPEFFIPFKMNWTMKENTNA